MITPNVLTIARVFLAILICAILVSATRIPTLLLCFFLFVLATLTDWWDGELARRKSLITNFGKIADPIADKILVLGLLFSFAYLKIYSVWWVVPILLREAAVTWIRTKKILEGNVIEAEYSGKVKTAIQMIAAGAAFLVLSTSRISHSGIMMNIFQVFLYANLIAANVLTLLSGYFFLKRNLN